MDKYIEYEEQFLSVSYEELSQLPDWQKLCNGQIIDGYGEIVGHQRANGELFDEDGCPMVFQF